jgi:formylglycine-generating enzyme required for sulfatase activity
MARATLATMLSLAVLASCDRSHGDGTGSAPTASGFVASTATAAPRPSGPTTTSTPGGSTMTALPGASPSCPLDMVLAEGSFCPAVEQRCLKHAKDYEEAQKRRERAREQGKELGPDRTVERCERYAPSRCLSRQRRPLRFCIDRYEWPNRPGELPALMNTWTQAQAACAGAGKRLCTTDEFTFACEGEQMLPYSYGLARDASRCNVDRPYVAPRRRLLPYDDCLKIAACKQHLAELDGRAPIGERPRCTSPFGAFDLNGNVNEWVERPGQDPPRRSGLKGGWWGPARSRCRPTVIAHDENYAGYEVGFRCCRDAAARP